MIIDAQNISKRYREGLGAWLSVIEGLDFNIERGQVIALTGESGVGKSTLLHVLGLLDKPSSGTILFDGQDVSKWDDSRLSKVRNAELGFIFQFHYLLPEFDARENVAIPALIAGRSQETAFAEANELLAQVGLSDRADHYPNALSGGEQQRVALARALINRPKLVLADEPTGNLDPKNEGMLIDLLFKLSQSIGTAVILATHNRELAKRAHFSYLLKDRHLNPISFN